MTDKQMKTVKESIITETTKLKKLVGQEVLDADPFFDRAIKLTELASVNPMAGDLMVKFYEVYMFRLNFTSENTYHLALGALMMNLWSNSLQDIPCDESISN